MGPYSGDSTPAASPSLEETPSSRSFFSRFALPIRQRTRNLADFHIRPADPHRKYSAGDHVCGAVILTILKPVRITHLTVSLHGYVRVYKGPNGAANEPAVVPAEIPAQGRSSLKYYGNGFASLFQDEQVLSADGRLETGKYEFNFDLLFPDKGLPSSIDFERGTISYMITATLTRPTPISPTTSCERKIYLVEKLDVGPLTPPRARTIYLEPLPKKSKRKRPVGADKGPAVASDTTEPASDLDSTRANENSTEGSLSVVGDDLGLDPAIHPRSPVPSDVRSEVSGDSGISGSTGLSRGAGGDHSHARESGSHQAGANRLSTTEDRTITATIELLKGGCLPGDMIPVKISVQHIKRIKSMHGVIVTLYRQGRIDSSPPLPPFKKLSKGREKEEYYPKSRTGLGGLSLSSAGPCSVFRKDLSQAFSPLIIDPVSLTASVTTSVRVPEDVFPTIKGVPGEMITFKYQLEVIVDLGGKLASQIQSGQSSAPRVGTLGAPAAIPLTSNPYEGGAASLASWGGSLIDTDRLRREKGVISVAFEVVVGTVDSMRQRGRGLSRPPASTYTQQVAESSIFEGPAEEKGGWQNGLEDDGHGHGYGHGPQAYSSEYGPIPADAPERYSYFSSPEPAAPVYIPPPEVPDDSGLTEKDRIRQAEQRLLPSQPTESPVAGPSTSPFLEGANIYDAEDEPEAGPSQPPPAQTSEGPSAPTLDELSSGTEAASTDDKQELERLRLLAEASVPPEFPEDCEPGPVAGPSSPAATTPSPATFEPSAPVLSDDEGYGPGYAMAEPSSSHLPSPPPEPLPRYER